MVDAFSTTIPDFVTETESPDEVIIRNINRIRSALPPFIYLLCRMATILESECLKRLFILFIFVCIFIK